MFHFGYVHKGLRLITHIHESVVDDSIQLWSDDVFLEIEPVIKSVIDGYNACIFAYGQTGTGKTFTMVRSRINETHLSLISFFFT